MAGDKKSRFTAPELVPPKTSAKRAFSGISVAVSDTREDISAEIQEHITVIAVECLENPEEERSRAMLEVTLQADADHQNWQEMDAEAFATESLENKHFTEAVQEQIMADPVAFIALQIEQIKEHKKQAMAEIESKDAASLAVSKIQQIIDQVGVSSNPELLQKLKQEIEKRTQVTLPDMQHKNASKLAKKTSVTKNGKM